VLFMDMSGFTSLAELLNRKGPDGAERLSGILDSCFVGFIETVLDHGGDIFRIVGDAMIVLWEVDTEKELSRAVALAAQCALAARNVVQEREFDGGVRLRLKGGIGAGTVLLSDMGGEGGRWEFMAAGEPLLEMARAEHAAGPGEIVLSPEAWRRLDGVAKGTELPSGEWRLDGLEPVPLTRVRLPEPLPRMEAALRAYIPEVALRRWEAGHTHWLAEFRNVSVMFINLGDAAFAASQGQERLQEAFRSIQVVLRRYEGAITQLVVDDKGVVVVAVFGLPHLSHEDDAARVVLSGLEVHHALDEQRLAHRIGITSGRVFCGAYGNAHRREYVAVGHTVNIAARLMQAADKGILCDAATAHLASSRVRFQTLPALRMKGITQPVPCFRPETPESRPSRELAAIRAPLVGREPERTQLEAAVRELAAGAGGVVVLEGEAGIGKSRLVQYLMDAARALGLRACLGAGDSLRQLSTYHAWHAPLSQLFGLEELSDADARATHLLARLKARPERREWAALLNAVLPVELPESEVVRQMGGGLRGTNTRELLVELLEDETRQGPRLLVLDDVHWMDASSWELALEAQRRVPRLLLVLATRPMNEQAPAEYRQLREGPRTRRLVLERMEPESVLELVCRRLGVRELPRPVAELIRERAEGHPFFSEELAFALRDGGYLEVREGECRLLPKADNLQRLDLPLTVQGVITSRIDRLTPQQQLTLKVASVLGRVFSLPMLREVHPLEKDEGVLRRELSILAHMDFLRLEVPGPQPSHAFKHVLIQEAAYNLMAFAQRRQIHRAVAHGLEAEPSRGGTESSLHVLLAHHWTRGEVPDKALEYLEKAGEAAYGRGANPEAVGFFTEAQELADRAPPGLAPVEPLRRARWSTALGMACLGRWMLEPGLVHFTQALRLLGKPTLPSSRFAWLMRLTHELGRQFLHVLLRRWLAPAREAKARERLSLSARIHAEFAPVYVWQRDFLALLTTNLSAVNDAERSGSLSSASRAYGSLVVIAGMFRLRRLAHHYLHLQGGQEGPRPPGAVPLDVTVLMAEGIMCLGQGRLDRALVVLERALEMSRAMNDYAYLPMRMSVAGVARSLYLPLTESVAHWEQLLEFGRRSANPQHLMWALISLPMPRMEQDRMDEALARLREAEALLPHADKITQSTFHHRAALVLWRTGDRPGAKAAIVRAMELMRELRPSSFNFADIIPLTALGEACLELWEDARLSGAADAEELAGAVARVCRLVRVLTLLYPVGLSRAYRLRGERARIQGRPREARRLFLLALNRARECGMAYDEALALLALARISSEPDARAEHLARARELFLRLGCTYRLKIADALAAPSPPPQSSPRQHAA
jgi:class 3 adenylate cyclase/tetratricopeptide (TPR) repeat protein